MGKSHKPPPSWQLHSQLKAQLPAGTRRPPPHYSWSSYAHPSTRHEEACTAALWAVCTFWGLTEGSRANNTGASVFRFTVCLQYMHRKILLCYSSDSGEQNSLQSLKHLKQIPVYILHFILWPI